MAPAFPDTLRFSESAQANASATPPQAKFPSFTMELDDGGDLHDITNVRGSHRNSMYRPGGGDVGNPPSVDTFEDGVETPEKPWNKPMDFDTMSSAPPASMSVEEDEGDEGGFDVPDRLTMGPGAAAARLDLHRCTMRVHKQLVDQIKTNSMKPASAPEVVEQREELSRCQGELWLKSRVPMRGWKKRYGSIVDHAYFGPVLFLFKYDAKGNVTLTNSMMIVLVDSHVRLGKNSTTRDRAYRCEFLLKTTKRRYVIAANHTMRRDYWLRNLETIQQQATTNNNYS